MSGLTERPRSRLLDVTHLVAPHLNVPERLALRQTYSAARDVVDWTFTSLRVPEALQSPDDKYKVIACIRGLLHRGARPAKLTLHPLIQSGITATA